MEEPDTPELRLKHLYGICLDILALYRAKPIVNFDSSNYTISTNEHFERDYYSSCTTSIIRLPDNLTSERKEKSPIKYIVEDEYNYRLIKGLARIFNDSLDKTQREAIIRKYFLNENYHIITRKMSISTRTYYRTIDRSIPILIERYGLDLYDEAGCIRTS